MELLRSFVAINETGSMVQATERVFVTQSALSLQMRRLEEIVRQPLFNRQGRKLRLAPAGEHLLSTARQILEMNDRAFSALQGQALSGNIRIGFNQDFAEIFLPGVLAARLCAVQRPKTHRQQLCAWRNWFGNRSRRSNEGCRLMNFSEDRRDWQDDGVPVILADQLDSNTAQTPGMSRAAAINFARVGAQGRARWPLQLSTGIDAAGSFACLTVINISYL